MCPRRFGQVLALASAAAVMAAAQVNADGGGPSPGLILGWNGVLAPGGKVRYVALVSRRRTIVEAVRVRGGKVMRWGVIQGEFGTPLVAFDGTTGGLSADGKTLVLTALPSPKPVSRFSILSTKTMRRHATVTLPGSWSYDAISPDASTLFLIEYLSVASSNPAYRVRAFDLGTKRLVPGAIVDRREAEAAMRGQAVTRVSSRDGSWAYTLYARSGKAPFVHALDTVREEAVCIDLPLALSQQKQMGLRLRLASDGGTLVVRDGRGPVATVDTKTFRARKN